MKTPKIIRTIFNRIWNKLDSYSTLKKITLFYIVLLFPFLYLHESHLPIGMILLLSIVTLVFSAILIILSILILNKIFQKDSEIILEFIFLAIFLTIIYFLHFFETTGGLFFLLTVLSIGIFFRYLKNYLYFKISLIGIMLLANGLSTFYFLQSCELYVFLKLFHSKYETVEQVSFHWNYNKENRKLVEESLKIEIQIPEDLFFHSSESLGLKDKTGSGQITGIISFSESNPDLYPYIRIFHIPSNIPPEIEILKKEFIDLLEFSLNKGDIEDIKSLGPSILESKKWNGFFWMFFDVMRPRFVKTGFYICPLSDGSHLILNIMENIEPEKEHEAIILNTLSSIIQTLN